MPELEKRAAWKGGACCVFGTHIGVLVVGSRRAGRRHGRSGGCSLAATALLEVVIAAATLAAAFVIATAIVGVVTTELIVPVMVATLG